MSKTQAHRNLAIMMIIDLLKEKVNPKTPLNRSNGGV